MAPLRLPFGAILLAVLLGGGFFVLGKYVETRDRTPVTIAVSGEGKVTASPDIAELTFGVQTGRKTTAKDAMTSLKKDMDAAFAAVKGAGVAEKDISTEQFFLSPAYDWENGKQVSRGFEAQETLRVKVRDLDKVSDVLSAATSAGANQAGNISFTIDDPQTLQAQAREKAITQAKEKAQKLAQDLGMRLGKIKGFAEGGGTVPPAPYARDMATSALGVGGGGGTVPLPAGQQEITEQVTLTYELQ